MDTFEARAGDVPNVVDDTAIIVGQGVPSFADDTLGTRYGKHWGPARILTPPECRPRGVGLCLTDTAFTHWELPPEQDGGMPDERETKWLVFAAARDSMQVFVARAPDSYLRMSPESADGYVGEMAINDASWIRPRFGHAGTYVFTAGITSDTVIRYQLRVAPVIATGATLPTGHSATLTISGDTTRRVAIAPASVASKLSSDAAWQPYTVNAGVYRMLLVRDSTYVACAVPCHTPQSFNVRAGRALTIHP